MPQQRISIDPAITMGRPCIKETRITVEPILSKLGAGRSFADLVAAYPDLIEDDARAALAFVADCMQHDRSRRRVMRFLGDQFRGIKTE
jgi:uncharacterized protein (DUF433 family)